MPVLDLKLPASVVFSVIVACIYLLPFVRRKGGEVGWIDTIMMVPIMGVISAASYHFLCIADDGAKTSALTQNLRVFRKQIESYRAEHDGEAPLLYKGTFPQLTNATNDRGVPGPGGSEFPHGPYLPEGIPPNPCTGVSFITPSESFPPASATGTGGWLYHQETGQIAPDLAEYLSE